MRKVAMAFAASMLISATANAQVMGPPIGPLMNIPGPGLPGYAAYGIAGAMGGGGPMYGYGGNGGYGMDISAGILGGIMPGIGGAYSAYNTGAYAAPPPPPPVAVAPRVAAAPVIVEQSPTVVEVFPGGRTRRSRRAAAPRVKVIAPRTTVVEEVIVQPSPRVNREVVIAQRARAVSCPVGMIPQPQPMYDQWGGWMGTRTVCY